ncbi:hypothetical protein MUK42_33814 [Musa troglodytarum]|uniref:Uncharacterized protein n=1 Tax=Musa troglodytarum TaxID=320322 RepID=A0A9E7JCG6_9LILI|nr:hypothetical protein MUK42_33814 [Musa troglodytarum]
MSSIRVALGIAASQGLESSRSVLLRAVLVMRVGAAAWWQATKAQSVQIAPKRKVPTPGDIGVIDTSVMTVALLRRCSAATARPKAIRSTTKMSMRTSLDARRIDARLQEAEAEMLAQSDSGRSAVAESSHRRKKSSNLKQGESAMNGDHEERREEVVLCNSREEVTLEGRNSVGAPLVRKMQLEEEQKTDHSRGKKLLGCQHLSPKRRMLGENRQRQIGRDEGLSSSDGETLLLPPMTVRGIGGADWTDALQPSKWANSVLVTTSDRRAYEVGQRSPLGALHQGNLQCGRDQRAIAVLCRMGDGFRDIRGERYVGLKSADQISIYGGKIEKGGVAKAVPYEECRSSSPKERSQIICSDIMIN